MEPALKALVACTAAWWLRWQPSHKGAVSFLYPILEKGLPEPDSLLNPTVQTKSSVFPKMLYFHLTNCAAFTGPETFTREEPWKRKPALISLCVSGSTEMRVTVRTCEQPPDKRLCQSHGLEQGCSQYVLVLGFGSRKCLCLMTVIILNHHAIIKGFSCNRLYNWLLWAIPRSCWACLAEFPLTAVWEGSGLLRAVSQYCLTVPRFWDCSWSRWIIRLLILGILKWHHKNNILFLRSQSHVLVVLVILLLPKNTAHKHGMLGFEKKNCVKGWES